MGLSITSTDNSDQGRWAWNKTTVHEANAGSFLGLIQVPPPRALETEPPHQCSSRLLAFRRPYEPQVLVLLHLACPSWGTVCKFSQFRVHDWTSVQPTISDDWHHWSTQGEPVPRTHRSLLSMASRRSFSSRNLCSPNRADYRTSWYYFSIVTQGLNVVTLNFCVHSFRKTFIHKYLSAVMVWFWYTPTGSWFRHLFSSCGCYLGRPWSVSEGRVQ